MIEELREDFDLEKTELNRKLSEQFDYEKTDLNRKLRDEFDKEKSELNKKITELMRRMSSASTASSLTPRITKTVLVQTENELMLSRSERLSNELNLSRQTTDRMSMVYAESTMGTEYSEDSAMSSIKRGGAGTNIMSTTPQMSKAS